MVISRNAATETERGVLVMLACSYTQDRKEVEEHLGAGLLVPPH